MDVNLEPLSPAELFKLSRQFVQDQLAAGYAPDTVGPLEAKGWENWLQTIWPFWFEEEFSADHRKFWDHYWNLLQRIKLKEKNIPSKDLAMLVLWGRGLGKSSVVEAARIMRGAILNGGYGLIISETDDQAQEHLGNARMLIEHPDSKLTQYYPGMAIAENAKELQGLKTADRKEMFVCKNEYVLRAKGLAAKMRGLRVGTRRPDDLCGDDLDDCNDSYTVSLNKIRLLTASILPVQARENVTVTLAQNLISEHSVVNQIYTGKSDALAERTVFGVANAFEFLDIQSHTDETGRRRHIIGEASIPTWQGLNIERAQKFLNDSGLETFLAEYQNQFDQFKSGKVIKEYNEQRQIITWSQFEKVYGTRQIPEHWQKKVGLDIGYTEGAQPHYSAWIFVATAANNSQLPGKVFVYRSRTFKGVSIDDQADAIKKDLYRDPMPGSNVIIEKPKQWLMSHEKTGEMMTLNQKHKIPFGKFKSYRAEDGVPQWRHLSRPDHSNANSFKPDELMADGTWLLGDTELFYIVDDDQEFFPEDDNGHKLLREQVSQWDYVPVKLTETGQTIQKPSKINDDTCDAAKGVFATFAPAATEMNKGEKMARQVAKMYPEGSIEQVNDPQKRAHLYSTKGIQSAAVREELNRSASVPVPDWAAAG